MSPRPRRRGRWQRQLATADATVDLSGPTACTLDPPTVRQQILARLGPDPLQKDARPSPVFDRIRRSRRSIGDVLMDQAVVGGMAPVGDSAVCGPRRDRGRRLWFR